MCPKHPLLTFVSGTLAATGFMFYVARRTEHDWRITAAFAVAGALAAFILVIAGKLVQLWLTDPITTPHPPPYLVFPPRGSPRLFLTSPRPRAAISVPFTSPTFTLWMAATTITSASIP